MIPHLQSPDADYRVAGNRMTILVPGEATGKRYSLLLAQAACGHATPPHVHSAGTGALVVLDGTIMVESPGRTRLARSGEVVSLPPHQPRRLSNGGSREAAYLLLCAPSGFERLVQSGRRKPAGAEADGTADGVADRCRCDGPPYGLRVVEETALRSPAARPTARVTGGGPRERFEAMGAMIEVLARLGDDRDGVVLLRATQGGGSRLRVRRSAAAGAPSAPIELFAGTVGGGLHGQLGFSSRPALLIVTTSGVARLLRDGCLPECLSPRDMVQQQLLALVRALHRAGEKPDLGERPTMPGPPPNRRPRRPASRNARAAGRPSPARRPSMHADHFTQFAGLDRRGPPALRYAAQNRRVAQICTSLLKNGLYAAGAAAATLLLVGSALLPMEVSSAMATVVRPWLRNGG
jgi:quercetin dioxygenase-like cupin family protein